MDNHPPPAVRRHLPARRGSGKPLRAARAEAGRAVATVTVASYPDLAAGIAAANDSPYGPNASIFTSDLPEALQAARKLRAGQVLVNETTAWRADDMPYGGVGESGDTREGPRWAVRAFTQASSSS